MGRRRAARARHPGDPGHCDDDLVRDVAGLECRALPDGRRDAGRHPRIRRPADLGPVLLQGTGRGRHPRLPRGRRARGEGRRDRRAARGAVPEVQRGQEDRHPALQLPDQARAHRQRSRPRHPGLGRAAAAGDARGRIHRRRVPRGRRPAHPLADRGRRTRRRMADRGSALDGHRARTAGRLRVLVRGPPGRVARKHPPALGRGARPALRGRRRDRARQPDLRQRGADDPAAARLRREPDRHLPRPGPAAEPPLPRRVPLAGAKLRRRRAAAPRQARHAGVAARQGPRHVSVLRPRRRARRAPADLPVHRQRPGRGHAGQAPRARDRRRPHDPADGPRRLLRRTGEAGATARRVRDGAGARPDEGSDAARPTRSSATCRWSTRSSSTTPARARRPSGAPTRPSSTT